MSHWTRIEFHFSQQIKPTGFVHALRVGGWVFAHDGQTFFLLNKDEQFDWTFGRAAELESILEMLDVHVEQSAYAGISGYWSESESGGEFLFHPSRNLVTFTVSIERRQLEGGEPFTDIGWYLQRLVPYLLDIHLQAVEATDCSD